jgi:hypothetical protein
MTAAPRRPPPPRAPPTQTTAATTDPALLGLPDGAEELGMVDASNDPNPDWNDYVDPNELGDEDELFYGGGGGGGGYGGDDAGGDEGAWGYGGEGGGEGGDDGGGGYYAYYDEHGNVVGYYPADGGGGYEGGEDYGGEGAGGELGGGAEGVGGGGGGLMDPSEIPLCSEYAASGRCRRGERCHLIHGDECEVSRSFVRSFVCLFWGLRARASPAPQNPPHPLPPPNPHPNTPPGPYFCRGAASFASTPTIPS